MALLKIHNPELGGILLHISPIWGIYIIYIPQMGDICKLHGKSRFFQHILRSKKSPQNGIYIVYTVFFRGISKNIPPQPRHFFVLGLRPRTKNASVSGVYCWIYPSKTPYIHYIYLYIYLYIYIHI